MEYLVAWFYFHFLSIFLPKVADVSAAAYICSLFHQRYADFTSLFKRSFIKLFDVINCKEEEKVQ